MGTFIPRYLDNLPQFFWWEADEVAVLALAFMGGLLTRQLTTCIVLGLVVAYVVSKSKTGKSEGFVMHRAYWMGVPVIKMKHAPDGTTRELVE